MGHSIKGTWNLSILTVRLHLAKGKDIQARTRANQRGKSPGERIYLLEPKVEPSSDQEKVATTLPLPAE